MRAASASAARMLCWQVGLAGLGWFGLLFSAAFHVQLVLQVHAVNVPQGVKVVRGLTPSELYAVRFAQQPRARKDAPAMMHQKIHVELPERDLVRQARAARDAAELGTATMTCSSLVGPVCMQSAHLSAMSERYERVFKPAVDDKRTRTVNTVRAAHKPTSQTSILRWADEETLTRVKDGRLGDVLVLFHVANAPASDAALAAVEEAASRLEGNVVTLAIDCSSELNSGLCRDHGVAGHASEDDVSDIKLETVRLGESGEVLEMDEGDAEAEAEAKLGVEFNEVRESVLKMMAKEMRAHLARNAPADVRLYVPHRPSGTGTRVARWEPSSMLRRSLRSQLKEGGGVGGGGAAAAQKSPTKIWTPPLLDFVAEHARSLRALRGAYVPDSFLVEVDEAWHVSRRHTLVSKASSEMVDVRFVNRRPYSAQLLWVDFDGREVLYHNLAPNGGRAQSSSYSHHRWVARDTETKQLLGMYQVESSSQSLVEWRIRGADDYDDDGNLEEEEDLEDDVVDVVDDVVDVVDDVLDNINVDVSHHHEHDDDDDEQEEEEEEEDEQEEEEEEEDEQEEL
ncbi:von Hippel-Lindau disease tumor suppressor beta domain-containing protein [Pseudoscourfieldia marina]